ncbi:MAG: SOS response-associated peptidase [Bowdeniella nasicola]|nr:SOS response-associated peptidase [Bowdeniella nasicola]
MCGRYAQFSAAEELAEIFQVQQITAPAGELLPSWNVAPTQGVRVIADSLTPGTRTMEVARWGLIPTWAKDPAIGARMINARAETVAEKPSYRGPLRYYRCIIPADGYYEWQAPPAGRRLKTPFYFRRSDGKPLAFAGLYSLWRDELLTCTIITRQARGDLAAIHHRQAVHLDDSTVDTWLDPTLQEPATLSELLALDCPDLEFHPVSRQVNAVRNNTPALITAIDAND